MAVKIEQDHNTNSNSIKGTIPLKEHTKDGQLQHTEEQELWTTKWLVDLTFFLKSKT